MIRAFAVVVVGLTTIGDARANDEPQQSTARPQISASALAQIDALIKEKQSRSPAEQKVDSQLIYELRMRSGRPIAAGVARLATDIPYASNGRAIVDVTAAPGSDLRGILGSLGAQIISASSDRTSLRIHIAIERVVTLAANPDVIFVRPRQDVKMSRRVAMAAQEPASNVMATNTGRGTRTSEGDMTHLAFAARVAFGVRGAGVKIGVLSDGVDSLASSQALGDLGPVTILSGQAGAGDEGTAMLEIIHDLAPEAQLFFATATTGIKTFADNIRALRKEGCDVIVDDVFYFTESPFHDGQIENDTLQVISPNNQGVVTQAVNDVTAEGALYFSSAGNSGNFDAGTSGTWEGNFTDFDPPLENGSYTLHDFGGGWFLNRILFATPNPINLYWSDPLGGAPNDYDLFLLNATATKVVASATNVQGVDVNQDPYEEMWVDDPQAGDQIIIAKQSGGAPRFLHLDINGGVLSIATAGQLHGHAQAAGAIAVAATPAFAAFPSPFKKSNVVEPFSSDGPRRIFYGPDNAPYTAGNLLASGGTLRQKPDLTAADGVQITGFGGFGNAFFGTSGSAPHAAAIAALIKSLTPAATASQVRAALLKTAIDIHAEGMDRNSGAGIVMATNALAAVAGAVPAVGPGEIATIEASDNPGNGNGTPEAGEGVRLSIPLVNYGKASASGVTATITTSTPGITIVEPSTRSYSDILPSGSAGAIPILFTVASNFPCPMAAAFTLTLNYEGNASPRVFDFQIPIGLSSYRFSNELGTKPVPAPGVDTSTGLQSSRLFRNSFASTCGVLKASSLVDETPATDRQFDSYAFNTCTQSVPSCVTVNLQGSNAGNLFTAAYSPTFNPANLQQNYRADPGGSLFFVSYSFDHPGAGRPFAIDVHDLAPASALPSGTPYTLTVTGACMGACDPPNHVPVAKAKDVTIDASANTCGTTASINDGSFDDDGDALEITQWPAGPYDIGATRVLLTVKDPKGAISQASAHVTVVDKTPPLLTCPASITVAAGSDVCNAAVSFSAEATDTCSPPVSVVSTNAVSVVSTLASGSIFPLGTTTVLTTATDAAGNTATCPLVVTVVDEEKPQLHCPAPITVAAPPGTCSVPVTFTPTATDACSSDVKVVSTPASGSTFAVGATTVETTATDTAGNSATCPLVVTVLDKEAPQLTCPAPITVPTAPGMCSAPVTFAPTATDTCSSDVTIVSTPASGSTFPLGTTTVATAATDASGNKATCPVVVTVADKEAPSINKLVLTPTQGPNRDWMDVAVDYEQVDNCGAGTCVLSVMGGATTSSALSIVGSAVRDTVSSSSDSTVGSFIIIDAHHVRLSADRSGKGNSRTYTVTVTCTDTSGNKTIKSSTITVRRD